MFLVPSNEKSILNSTLSLLQQQQQHKASHSSGTTTSVRLHSPNHQISHHIILKERDETQGLTNSFSIRTHLKSFKKILKLFIRSSTIVCRFLINVTIWTLKRWARFSSGLLVAILDPTTTIRRCQTRLPLSSIALNLAYYGSTTKATASGTNLDLPRATSSVASISLESKAVNPTASSESESLSSDSESYYTSFFHDGTNFSGTNYKQRGFRSNNNHYYKQLNNHFEYYEGMDLCRRRIAQRTSSLNNSSGNNNNNNNNHVDPSSAAACFWRLHSLPQALSNSGASAVRLLDDGEETQGNSWNQELFGNASAEGHQQRRQLLRRDRRQATPASAIVSAVAAASSQTPIEHFQGQQQQTGPQIESGGGDLSSEPEIGKGLYKYDLLLNRETSGQQQQQQQHEQKQEVLFQKQLLQQRQQARIVDEHDLHSNQRLSQPNNFDFNSKYFSCINKGKNKNRNSITTDCVTHSPSSTLMSSLFTTNHHQPLARLQKQKHQQTQRQPSTYSSPYNNQLTVATKDNSNVTLEEQDDDDAGVRRSLLVDANDDCANFQAVSNRTFNALNSEFHHQHQNLDTNLSSGGGLVVVSKRALSNITDQIAFSMSKMKDLEEQVRVIPELQRKLDHVMSDVASSTTSLHTTPVKQYLSHGNNQHNHHQNNNNNNSNQQHLSQPLDCGCQSFREHLRYNYNSISREQRLNHYMKSQTLSSTNNSLNGINGNHNSASSYNHLLSPIRSQVNNNIAATAQNKMIKVDASTNTELSMGDIVTRPEVDSLVATMQKTYSSLSSSLMTSRNRLQSGEDAILLDDNVNNNNHNRKEKRRSFVSKSIVRKSSTSSPSSPSEASTSGSISGPKSSSPVYSRSDSCEDDARVGDDDGEDGEMKSEECYSNKCIIDETEDLASELSDKVDDEISDEKQKLQQEQQLDCNKSSDHDNHEHIYDNNTEQRQQKVDDEDDEDELQDEENGTSWLDGDQEPYSLGSSYQDPSDFEEYCAYGESLDRRTKDFMSQSTKIPNDLRFALIRLNDFIKRNKSFDQIKTSSSCIEVIRKEWFDVTASKDSQALKTKLYVDYFESFTKQLLNTVVNLTDSAGNAAMHYAASHYKLDIIKVLLETKVCDVNCRNRAGYTPIMLLALAEIDIFDNEQRHIAKRLFSLGDVNIKARTSGQTALMLAASHGRKNTCKLLLECGADPSLQDYDGSTALMCGSEVGNEDVVRCLLAHKLTDPTAVDNDGLDALTIAMNNGHKSIGLMLYAAKNVPRMNRFPNSAAVISGKSSSGVGAGAGASNLGVGSNNSNININNTMFSTSTCYLGASLRRSRARLSTNYVGRADSLFGSRSARATIKH